jgi:2'-5' RNA ligase
MKRLFIAIPIEKKWEKIFEKYRDPMGDITWLKWEPLPKLHVTVLFLGPTDEELIPEIEDALGDIVAAQTPFELTLEKITYAPEGKRASMIWAKWKQQPEFATLTARVREELSYIVGKVNADPILAHTTLSRFDKKAIGPKELIHLKHTLHEGEAMPVKKILLMETIDTPTGSLFKQLSEFTLNKDSEEVVSREGEVVS